MNKYQFAKIIMTIIMSVLHIFLLRKITNGELNKSFEKFCFLKTAL